ncbi:MAG: V-type ATP synthase subunit D [Desulfuromonadales bacterium]|nr:V-type ATP synthase subunit D [Desulfuromonadales bacterium]MDT8422158.1 V-type ATP synthase subunit D [Desulfuromonadales bacterium]
MIQATRTNLLLLKERRHAVINCTTILKGRRQALIKKFLEIGRPLITSREETRQHYGQGIDALQTSIGLEGQDYIASLALISQRHLGVTVTQTNILGLHYYDLQEVESVRRTLVERGYDYPSTTPRLDETLHLFETIIEEMLAMARYEGMFRRLGEELLRVTRRIRVLEERVQPALKSEIKDITHYLAERERETYYRMKLFKKRATGGRRH